VEFRDLFYAPEPWVLVGCDMSGIELRMLAHYAYPFDQGELAKVVLEGDIHTANQEAFGCETRDLAKTGIYALIYGASDARLGRQLYPTAPREQHKEMGRAARARVMERFHGLFSLTEAISLRAKTRGYLVALDGRKLPVRNEYSALNNVLQSAAAICAKQWIVNLNETMTGAFGPPGWDGRWVPQLFIHDELEIAVRNDPSENAAQHMRISLERAGRDFNLNVPLTGKATIGHTWADVHS
jgi:DNA polymerase-1